MHESIEKKDYAEKLLKLNLPYREIQIILKQKFETGMSNSSLQKLRNNQQKKKDLEAENELLRHELTIFKKLYFELINSMKEKIND